MFRSLMFAAFVFSSVVFADSVNRSLKTAADSVEDAYDRTQRARAHCRQTIGPQLDALVDRVDDLRKNPSGQLLGEVKGSLSSVGMAAPVAGCPVEVNDDIQKAVEALEDARVSMWNSRGNGRGDGRGDDRRNRRKGDDPVVSDLNDFAQMSPLQVQPNAAFEGEAAVRVSVPELRLYNLQGRQFYLGARFRSYEGEWSEWTTTQVWSVPNNAFVWKNAFNHFFRYSTLAEDDFSQGRFMAHVSVFDQDGRELAFREASFRVRLPQLPNAPPPVVVQPPPVVMARDCGTGPQDPGCQMVRDGQYPMDRDVFGGVMQAIRGNSSEMMRAQAVQAMLARNYLTALQLMRVLDSFESEMIRVKMAEIAAPHVVNPQHALGYAAKFRSNIMAQGYTQLMSQQPQGTAPGAPPVVVQMPPPGYRPPPPGVVVAVPAPVYRDCGTGNDPGCTMVRNGHEPMDAATFNGVLTSLRGTANELIRESMCESFVNANYLTAAQFGMVLDLFSGEITRMDVARKAVTHVVNPQHALGFSTKFRNSIYANDYAELIASQR